MSRLIKFLALLLILSLALAACGGDAPTEAPVTEPTEAPVLEPTAEPVEEPTEEPMEEPTEEPVEEPTEEPMDEPTEEPADEPAEEPADEPVAGAGDVVFAGQLKTEDGNDLVIAVLVNHGAALVRQVAERKAQLVPPFVGAAIEEENRNDHSSLVEER